MFTGKKNAVRTKLRFRSCYSLQSQKLVHLKVTQIGHQIFIHPKTELLFFDFPACFLHIKNFFHSKCSNQMLFNFFSNRWSLTAFILMGNFMTLSFFIAIWQKNCRRVWPKQFDSLKHKKYAFFRKRWAFHKKYLNLLKIGKCGKYAVNCVSNCHFLKFKIMIPALNGRFHKNQIYFNVG